MVKNDKCTGVSKLFRGHVPGLPPPKFTPMTEGRRDIPTTKNCRGRWAISLAAALSIDYRKRREIGLIVHI